jgi:hypothetical protein
MASRRNRYGFREGTFARGRDSIAPTLISADPTEVLKPLPVRRGTDGSNPLPSSREPGANSRLTRLRSLDAKILECGAAAVAVRTAPDCMMAVSAFSFLGLRLPQTEPALTLSPVGSQTVSLTVSRKSSTELRWAVISHLRPQPRSCSAKRSARLQFRIPARLRKQYFLVLLK